jgi:hypothetical protein
LVSDTVATPLHPPSASPPSPRRTGEFSEWRASSRLGKAAAAAPVWEDDEALYLEDLNHQREQLQRHKQQGAGVLPPTEEGSPEQ